MSPSLALLVFTDLDGTLLDHGSYRWDAARPALTALARIGAGVVLASSKTAAEMAPLRDRLGLGDWPAIVENGGGVLPPGTGGELPANTHQTVRARLSGLPAGFVGFSDLSVADLAELTGLSTDAAGLAKQRRFTEPGIWTGAEADLPDFLNAAEQAGLGATRGGRFLTLSLGQTKAGRMQEIIDRTRPLHSIALGDAPNDAEMLQAADHGVIVQNPHGSGVPPLPGEATGRIRRTTRPGPAGWNRAVLDLLQELTLIGDPQGDG